MLKNIFLLIFTIPFVFLLAAGTQTHANEQDIILKAEANQGVHFQHLFGTRELFEITDKEDSQELLNIISASMLLPLSEEAIASHHKTSFRFSFIFHADSGVIYRFESQGNLLIVYENGDDSEPAYYGVSLSDFERVRDIHSRYTVFDNPESILTVSADCVIIREYDYDTDLIFEWVYIPQNPITRGCIHEYYDIPARSPRLYLSLNTGGLSTQNFRATGGTTSWFLFYQASGFHPLDFWRETQSDIDFNAFIGQLEDTGNGEIELIFSHFPPDTVYVRRWRAEFIGMASDMRSVYGLVEVNDNIIRISDNGYDYIYEVEAIWIRGDYIPVKGRVSYTFRINSAR